MNNIELLHRTRISGENLSMSQMIMFHHISSKNNSAFSTRLTKHFGENIKAKEDALMALITQIESFTNGLLFTQGTGRSAGTAIKPFNYTLKPFLKVQNPGSANLITKLTESDKGFLTLLKQDLWGVLIKLY